MIYTFSEQVIFHQNRSVAFNSGCSCCFRLLNTFIVRWRRAEEKLGQDRTHHHHLHHFHCSCPLSPPPLPCGPYPKSDATSARGESPFSPCHLHGEGSCLCDSFFGVSLSRQLRFFRIEMFEMSPSKHKPKDGAASPPEGQRAMLLRGLNARGFC